MGNNTGYTYPLISLEEIISEFEASENKNGISTSKPTIIIRGTAFS